MLRRSKSAPLLSSTFAPGFLAGWIANLLIYTWLWPTFRAAGINTPTTLGCWMALSAVLAIYTGAFATGYALIPWPAARPWIGAALWVALDEIRTVALTGFPWALLSHTQARHPAVIQIAALTGAAGVTYLLVVTSAVLAEISAAPRDRPGRRRSRQAVTAVAALVLVSVIAGNARLNSKLSPGWRPFTASILQGNIDQYRKWDDAYEADIRTTYQALTNEAATQKPDLIVWPETAVPGWIPRDGFYVDWVEGVARRSGRSHLFGALANYLNREFNAVFLVAEDGKFVGQYNKEHLVPFGEYVPFGGFLKGLIPYLGQVGVFNAGDGPEVFQVGEVRLAPNICYEMIFPSLVRRSVREADVIVNVTNDGWFLASGAPEQHFVTAIFRAVENGRPVIRAANTGISAFIDALGRVRLESPLLTAGAFTDALPVPPRNFRTPFGRWGNWFGWLCFAVAIGSAGSIAKRFRRDRPR